MASTALVPPSASLADMTHNQFAEFVSIGGLLGGAFAVAVVAIVFMRLLKYWRLGRDPATGAVLAAFVIWIANSFFANGTAYQPINASILFIAMFLAARRTSNESLKGIIQTETKGPAPSRRKEVP